METVDLEYEGVSMTVIGEYEKAEEEERYSSDLSGYPGCAASFEVQQVLVCGNDITDLIDQVHFAKISEKIFSLGLLDNSN